MSRPTRYFIGSDGPLSRPTSADLAPQRETEAEMIWVGQRPRSVTPPSLRDRDEQQAGRKSPRLGNTSSPRAAAQKMMALSGLRGAPVRREAGRGGQVVSRGGRNLKMSPNQNEDEQGEKLDDADLRGR